MNVQEGLQQIRERLVEQDASPATLKLVDGIMQRASLPAAASATAGSLLQLVRMLMRSPQAGTNPTVYNDLVRIEADLEERAAGFRERQAAEDAKPMPKLKKHYK
ncbi:MAG TPA: hypothetical protein VD789_01570, partial [Thermomicrobiales bacterium]|nr:hypothetical protein [Thermomicrobiales bacterium]